MFSVVAAVFLVANLVDNDGAGQNQDLIFAFRDVNAVGVSPREPAFRHLRDFAAATPEGVLVVEKVALGIKVIGARHIHGEFAAEERKELLFDDRGELAVAIDLIGG